MTNTNNYKQPKARTYKQHIGITHPEIAQTLHPTKNNYTVEQLTKGSDSRIVWWLCPTCQSEWKCTPFRRIYKEQGCPTCAINNFPIHQSFGYHYPDLLNEWHPERNQNLSPFVISIGSARLIWWKCQTCSHEWQAKVWSRTTASSGCPVCQRKKHREHLKKIRLVEPENNLSITHPQLEIAWDTEKNFPLMFKHVSKGSSRRTWWKCPHCQNSFSRITASIVEKESRQLCRSCQKPIYETKRQAG